MQAPRRRRRWVALGAIGLVAILAFAGYRLLDKPNAIYYYRVVDEHTLVAGTISGPNANVRVTNIVETPGTVTITVSALSVSIGASSGAGTMYESLATLTQPLGGRTV